MTGAEAFDGWSVVLGRLAAGADLSAEQSRSALAQILAGAATDAQIAALIVALRIKGETVDEVTGMVEAMLDASEPLDLPAAAIDIVGTGGSPRRRVRALNVSTMASIVSAAAGAAVCKHGNRKASSTSGAFDLLEALGVGIDLDGAQVRACLDDVGVAFCFARSFHPAMRFAGPVRAELGIPTVFNVLGPLSHPGRLRRQVVGVGDPRLIDLVAGVLAARSLDHALVVHGADSLDELTLTGTSTIVEVRDGAIVDRREVTPEQFGLAVVAEHDMPGGDAADNAALARAMLEGATGPVRDIVGLNAGAALYAGGVTATIALGIAAAFAAIDDGRAAALLDRLVAVTSAGPS